MPFCHSECQDCSPHCLCESEQCVFDTCSVQATVLGAACRFLLCQTPPKTCFVIGFCLSCWFWVRWIRSLKRWIGLSRNSLVWGQTHQVMKMIQFLLSHLCQKQIKTQTKKIFEDFEIASSEVGLNSPLSWFHMKKVRLGCFHKISPVIIFPLPLWGFMRQTQRWSFVPPICTTGFIRYIFKRYSSLSSRRLLSGITPNSG